MSFIFAKWATVHALNPMGPIASYLKAHNLSGAPSYFMISHYFNITCNPKPKILFFCHLVDCFNTGSDVLAATHVDCILAGCSSSHEVACIRGRKSLTSAHRLPASPASKASLVTSSRCEQRLNGAGCSPKNGTSMRLKIGAGMALQWRWLQPQKWQLNSARYGA